MKKIIFLFFIYFILLLNNCDYLINIDNIDNSGYLGDNFEMNNSPYLIAGIYSDIENWDNFIKLITNKPFNLIMNYWGWNLTNRIIIKIANSNNSHNNIKFHIINQNHVLWSAYPDKQGICYLYPDVFTNYKGPYYIQMSNNNEIINITNTTNINNLIIHYYITNSNIINSNIYLVFALDTTESMQNKLEFLKNNFINIITNLTNSLKDFSINIGILFFKDRGEIYTTKKYNFTSDYEYLYIILSNEKCSGGGDYEEGIDIALSNSIYDFSWEIDSYLKLIFLFTDSSPYNNKSIMNIYNNSIKEAANKGIIIIPVISSMAKRKTEILMRLSAIATGGVFVAINENKNIRNNLIKTMEINEFTNLENSLIKVIKHYIENIN